MNRDELGTPGFQIGTEAEKSGAPGKIMNFMNAMTLLTVPLLSVIIRKSYGRAYVCMGGGRHSDDVAAWPTAEISFMSPDFATKWPMEVAIVVAIEDTDQITGISSPRLVASTG